MISNDIKTPYFVIEKQILDKYWNMLNDSLNQNWNNYQIGYSFKTNSLPWLVTYLKNKGAFQKFVSTLRDKDGKQLVLTF